MSIKNRGVFIAIEGTDGSGKGTQAELLANRLEKDGYDVVVFDFPQYDQPSSYFVTKYLNGGYGTVDEVGPYTGSLFFSLDRYEAAPRIREALAQGKVIIANRFTGSNLAHQGTKFAHAEQRRGYFIWLDNLEFELLGIPRPDKSIVLRVPAEIAQTLVDKKDARSYTDEKRDIHESDLSHLQRSVEVYDDLCQLFPQDFMRIDCVRSGKIMSIQEIHEHLLKSIEPLLPPQKKRQPATPQTDSDGVYSEQLYPATGSSGDQDNSDLVFISELLASKIGQNLPADLKQAAANRFDPAKKPLDYYIPPQLDKTTQRKYQQTIETVLDLHSQMATKLNQYISNNSNSKNTSTTARHQTLDTLQAVLPMATFLRPGMSTSDQFSTKFIRQLSHDDLTEAREVAQKILTKERRPSPAINPNNSSNKQDQPTDNLQQIIQSNLMNSYSSRSDSVRLISHWPKNELQLVPAIIYQHSSLPIAEIQSQVDSWSVDLKYQALESYLGQSTALNHTDPVLDSTRYNWELMCDYTAFSYLIARLLPSSSFQLQPLTPRYGYEVPAVIEEAGLSDQFEECFDLSLSLHSLIQSAGYPTEAQYATLRGHNLRWQLSCNIRQILKLYQAKAENLPELGARAMIVKIQQRTVEAHPVVASILTKLPEINPIQLSNRLSKKS